ncbi:hypothetical protein FAVG1_13190 [Fusarium avenaceum]|nr:hypothetical protein FAVG1_13190 [Fusarium avenaceum]
MSSPTDDEQGQELTWRHFEDIIITWLRRCSQYLFTGFQLPKSLASSPSILASSSQTLTRHISLHRSAAPNSAFSSSLIDKSLLKAGSYRLTVQLRVEGASDDMFDDGCNAMAVGCFYGDPSSFNPVQGGSNIASAKTAVQQWAPLSVICLLKQDKLDQYGYLGVSIGFSCANAQGKVHIASMAPSVPSNL